MAKDKQINVRLSAPLKLALEMVAHEERRSVAWVVVEAIEFFLEARGQARRAGMLEPVFPPRVVQSKGKRPPRAYKWRARRVVR